MKTSECKSTFKYKCYSSRCMAEPFDDNVQLLRHISVSHPKELKTLTKCFYCEDILPHSNMNEHVQTMHPYKCLLCTAHFGEASAWTNHMDSAHRQNCGYCNAFFWNLVELIEHVRVHINVEPTGAGDDDSEEEVQKEVQKKAEKKAEKKAKKEAEKGAKKEAKKEAEKDVENIEQLAEEKGLPIDKDDVSESISQTEKNTDEDVGNCSEKDISKEDPVAFTEQGAAQARPSELTRARCRFCWAELAENTQESIDEHVMTCPSYCRICDQLILGNIFDMAKHQQKQHPLHCRRCGERHVCLMDLYKHMEAAHDKIMCWMCTSVNPVTEASFISYDTRKSRDDHVANAHHLAFGCSHCSLRLQSRKELTHHEKLCGGPSYCCADCSREFNSEEELNHHLDLHKVKTPELPTIDEATCPFCLKTFSSEARCNAHVASTKMRCRMRTISCLGEVKGCKKKFYTETGMIAHLESGACKSRMNKEMLDRIIEANDVNGTITHVVELDSTEISGAVLQAPREQLLVEDSRGVADKLDITPDSSCSHTPTSPCSPGLTSPAHQSDLSPHSPSAPPTLPTAHLLPGTDLSAELSPPISSGLGTPTSSPSLSVTNSVMDPAKLALKLESLSPPMFSPFPAEIRYHCPAILISDLPVALHKKREFKYLSGLLCHIEAKCEEKVGEEVLKRAVAVLEEIFSGSKIHGGDMFRNALPASKC